MKKMLSGLRAAAVGLIGMTGIGLTVFAGPVSAAGTVSVQDTTWMRSNAQTDLAEISLGTLASSRSSNSQLLSVAARTKSDHETALAKLQSLARSLGVTLPTAPNSQQQSQAAQLQQLTGSKFDARWVSVQIAGHEQSISQTNTEISSGSNASVIAFAKYYLPIAQMHLQMVESLQSSLTGTAVPPRVEAGSGGMAATHAQSDTTWYLIMAAGGVLLVSATGFAVRRRAVAHR